jgi:hypothetical protein
VRAVFQTVFPPPSARGRHDGRAAQGSGSVVVLHVTDHAGVSPADLASAEQQAARVYDAAGVRIAWTDGSLRTAQPDGAAHVDVILLSTEMVARTVLFEQFSDAVCGFAVRPTRRAYIFYNRIVDRAIRTRSPLDRLLAVVIAHEVGHLLLPRYSHSPSGKQHSTPQRCSVASINWAASNRARTRT